MFKFEARFVLIALLLPLAGPGAVRADFITISVPGSTSTTATAIDGNNVVGYFSSGTGGGNFLFNGSSYTILTGPALTGTVIAVSGNLAFGDTSVSGPSVPYVVNLSNQPYTGPRLGNVGSTVAIYAASDNTVLGQYAQNGVPGTHDFTQSVQGGPIHSITIPSVYWDAPRGLSGNTIVGSLQNTTGIHGYTLTGSTLTLLDAPGAVWTSATGISGSHIVGIYDDGTRIRSFIYDGVTYAPIDVPGSIGTYVNGISGSTIIGTYTDQSGTHSFEETLAAPEPGSLTLAGMGLLGIVGLRLRVRASRASISRWPASCDRRELHRQSCRLFVVGRECLLDRTRTLHREGADPGRRLSAPKAARESLQGYGMCVLLQLPSSASRRSRIARRIWSFRIGHLLLGTAHASRQRYGRLSGARRSSASSCSMGLRLLSAKRSTFHSPASSLK